MMSTGQSRRDHLRRLATLARLGRIEFSSTLFSSFECGVVKTFRYVTYYMPFDDDQIAEQQRRMETAIDAKSAHHMSDAKWRKLLNALEGCGIVLDWKFLRDDRVFQSPPLGGSALLETQFADIHPFPYSPYREIEWIAFPGTDIATVHSLVDSVGTFMIVPVGDDTRILAYS